MTTLEQLREDVTHRLTFASLSHLSIQRATIIGALRKIAEYHRARGEFQKALRRENVCLALKKDRLDTKRSLPMQAAEFYLHELFMPQNS